MSVAARRIDPDDWTKDQFLEWALNQERSYEFDGARPVAMSPAAAGHNEIAFNIRARLRDGLPPGMGRRAYGPDQPIETIGGALREPDVFIACSAFKRTAVVIPAPIVVFEVVSPGKSDRQRDEIEKAAEYEAVPTILRYVIVESENRGARVLWREPGDFEWRREPLDGAGPIHLPEFGITLAFNDIYEGVEFD